MYKNYMYESVFAELLHEYIAARREAGFQLAVANPILPTTMLP